MARLAYKLPTDGATVGTRTVGLWMKPGQFVEVAGVRIECISVVGRKARLLVTHNGIEEEIEVDGAAAPDLTNDPKSA